jgi:hypothetical protein
MRNLSHFLILCYCVLGNLQYLQSQDINYTVNSPVCRSENLIFENNSTAIDSYQWDFCMNDLDSVPVLSNTLVDQTGAFTVDYTVVYDSGKWHGFLTDFLANKITRIDYVSDLKSSTTSNFLGHLVALVHGPVHHQIPS